MVSSVVILMAVTLVQRSVGFGRGILFCRWLTPETLGEWEMVYSFLLLAAPLAVLGVPGSYGRYLEFFRQRGHLRTFLRRTAVWTSVCSVAGLLAVVWFAPQVSSLLFGRDDYVGLIRGIGFCLAAVILQHTLTSLLTALRLFRVVSAMTFSQSLLFASIALVLLHFYPQVTSILVGYGAACLVSSLGAIAWVWPGLREIDRPVDVLPHSQFWPRLLRFAFFVWMTNLLAHLFAIVDRYMIIHYSGMEQAESLQQVGFYHSSRIVPLLLVSFADLLSGLVMPHLSHDWEAGRHERVGKRLNLTVKLTGLGMLGFGVCVLIFAPWLFDVVLQGKYSNGLAVLPWALAGCTWYGIYSIAQNYLWCAEKARLASATLAVGLAVNIALNLLLLPIWGLLGAVIATAVSTLLCLAVILEVSRRQGMTLDRGTWMIAIAPLALAAGSTVAAATLATLLLAGLSTNLLLSVDERKQLSELAVDGLTKLKAKTGKTVPATSGA